MQSLSRQPALHSVVLALASFPGWVSQPGLTLNTDTPHRYRIMCLQSAPLTSHTVVTVDLQ